MAIENREQLTTLLNSLATRRDFIQHAGKGAGFLSLITLMPACGGGSGASDDSSAPVLQASPAIPSASAQFTTLKRTSYGVHAQELDRINSIGIDAYLEEQLNPNSINDGDLQTQIDVLFPLTNMSPAQLISEFPDNIGDVALQMASATQYRQIYSQRQLNEIMVEFWSDHFNIHLLNGLGPTLKPEDDLAVIRTHAMGKFSDLLNASASSASMLFYLDNYLNLAAAPNENYARELMELHTLGVDGGYTETDVKEVARCFTGWTFRFPGDISGAYGTFTFNDSVHDNNVKMVLGNQISNGDINDGIQVLDILATHPSTALFIARKLCQRFITDNPDVDTVTAVANAFTSSAGDITSTLRALFSTAAFQTTSDLKFIRPSEFLAAIVRGLAPNGGYPSDSGTLFYFAQSILGQLPHNWPTPDGYPDVKSYWENTGNMLNRWRLSFLSLGNIISSIDVFGLDYATLLDSANTPAQVVDALAERMLMRPLAVVDRQHILDWILLEYTYEENALLPSGTPTVLASLITATLISSAYFQLR